MKGRKRRTLKGTKHEDVGLSLDVESNPVDLVVLNGIELFKEDGGDVREIADQVGFKLDNTFDRSDRVLPEFRERHDCEQVEWVL